MNGTLEDRLVPIGKEYDLPMVSVKAAVVPQFSKNTVVTKRQYFYDIFHPTNDGHRIMADCLIGLFEQAAKAPMPENDSDFTVKPVKGAEFENIILVDSTNIEQYGTVSHKGFDHKDTEIQYVERNLSSQASPVLENGWAKAYETKDAEFVMEITARNIVLVSKDSGTPKFGKADIYVDDKLALTADPLVNGWNHCNPQIILNETESGKTRCKNCDASGR